MRTNAPMVIALCAVLACSCGSSRAAPEPTAAPAPTLPPASPAPAAEPGVSPASPPQAADHTPKLVELPIPELKGRVNDVARIFSPAEVGKLSKKLAAHEKATGQQFVVLTWNDLQGTSIDAFGFAVANAWKLGDAKKNDGLLIVVALQDRKVRIEVGTGLEQAIPDELAARIIAEQMAPEFRKGEYASGVEAALDKLFAAARRAK